MSDKTIVNALWLGSNKFSFLEMLTMRSFISFGHEFHLWMYEPLNDVPPKGVVVRDGNEILSRNRIFRYPNNMLLGFGHNSYVGFSEIFRYKVLYDLGGWWSDMDVTCLKSLDDIHDEYWFRFHGVLSVVGNIMRVPAKSELMKRCYERASIEVNSQQRDWHHAIRILCYNIENLGLDKYIHYDACNLDRIDLVNPFIYNEMDLNQLPSSWRFIHWMNSVIGRHYHNNSIMQKLVLKFNCIEKAMYL
jgi:hypothetical protein